MGDPILRLATRWTPRTRATAWGIAFACMVLAGGLTLVDGLRGGVDSVAARIEPDVSVYIQGDDLLASRIDPNSVVEAGVDFDALRMHIGRLEVNGIVREVVVASFEQHRGGTVTQDFPYAADALSIDVGLRTEIEAASGRPLESEGNLTLLGLRLTGLPIAGPPSSRPEILPATWAWVTADLLIAMNPEEGGTIQALFVESGVDAGFAESLGLRRLDAMGAVGFFRGSADEATRAFVALAAVIAVVIGLLVYGAMSLEVHQRTEEIRTLRAVGSPSRTVAAVYEGRALLLAAFGAAVGSALGIVTAHGIVSFAPLVGLPNLVVLGPPLPGAALAAGVAFAASAAAGIVPSRRAARLARSREARRS